MALIADPIHHKAPFTATIDVCGAHGKTPPNIHQDAFGMLRVLSGSGIAYCNGETFAITCGDSFMVRPGHEHVVETPMLNASIASWRSPTSRPHERSESGKSVTSRSNSMKPSAWCSAVSRPFSAVDSVASPAAPSGLMSPAIQP